jgi:hypothetical protein
MALRGFLITSPLDINDFGVTVTNAFFTFERTPLRVTPLKNGNFRVHCNGKIYKSRAAFNNDKGPLMGVTIDETIDDDQLNANIVRRMYNIAKAAYPSTTDVVGS